MYTTSSAVQPDLLLDSTTNSEIFFFISQLPLCIIALYLLAVVSLVFFSSWCRFLIFFYKKKYKYEAKNWLQYCIHFHPLNSFFMRPPSPYPILLQLVHSFSWIWIALLISFLCNIKFLRHLQLSTLLAFHFLPIYNAFSIFILLSAHTLVNFICCIFVWIFNDQFLHIRYNLTDIQNCWLCARFSHFFIITHERCMCFTFILIFFFPSPTKWW